MVHRAARLLQLLGMSLLLVDIFFTDQGQGPSARVFLAGVVVFLLGWGLERFCARGRA